MKLPNGTNSDRYTLSDGGVFANNPDACALMEARTTHPNAAGYLVVSLGTGEMTHSLSYNAAKDWGLAQLSIPTLDVVFGDVSKTVDYQLRQLLPDMPGQCQRYYRFQTTLEGRDHRFDNTSPASITALKALAYELVEKKSDDLDTICDELVK